MNNTNKFWELRTAVTEWLTKSQQTSPADIRIGIWGTSDSGKTTYLAMLYNALVLSKDWRVEVDKPGRKFVKNNLNDIKNGNFPPPTEIADTLNIFTYTLTPESYKGTGTKFVLNFIDAPGQFYEDILGNAATKVRVTGARSQPANGDTQVSETQNYSGDIVDYLLSCDGIIFLLDPIQSQEKSNSYWTMLLDLFMEFQERSRRKDTDTQRLQQYMAFCVTKVDKKEIWSQGKKSADLARNVMGEDLFESLEINFCFPNRYKFFSVASIGPYQDKDSKWKEAVIYPDIPDNSNTSTHQASQSSPKNSYSEGYDPDAPSGTANTPPSSSSSSTGGWASGSNTPSTPEPPPTLRPTINTKVRHRPFNVIEPIQWLIQSIQANPPSRPHDK